MPDPPLSELHLAPSSRDAPIAGLPLLAALDSILPWLLLDAGLRVRALGEAAARELGLDAARAAGRTWSELFPDAGGHDPQRDARPGGAGAVAPRPMITVIADGAAPRHFMVDFRPLPAGDPGGAAWLALLAEATAQVEALAAQRRDADRFRAIIQHSRDLIIVCSADGRIQFASSALETVSGVRPEDRVGGSVFERLHPDDAARARSHIGRLVQDASRGVSTRLELRLASAAGGWRWIECTAANLLGHPAVNGIVLNCRDVTDRKQAEAALAAADARLDTALRTSRTAYWSIDVDADRATMSPHFFELTGIDRDDWEAGPHPWYSRVHADDLAVVHRAYEDCLAGQREFYECDYRLRTPGGWLWLHDRGCIAERDDSGRPRVLAGTSQDASWRKRMEDALRDSARSERRRLNEDLHDGLGQELSGIQFMLAGIGAQLRREDSRHAAEIELTLELVRRALATTRSISRGLEPANPKSGGLRAAMLQLATDLSEQFRIPIRFEPPSTGLPAMPDAVADTLFLMVREALDHACRHGGRSLVVGASAADGMLEISVADEGPGLSGPAVPGADAPALGLRILAYRARTIGAQLAFEAGPGAGSRVRIRHPLEARQVPGAT